MKIDVSSIKHQLGGVLNVQESVKFADVKMKSRNIRLSEPIRLDLVINNSGSEYLITGTMFVDSILDCSRCLEPFHYPFKIDFYEEIAKTGLENDNLIDITDSIYEHLFLEIPIKTICDDNCRGLCSKCGQNLNIKDCGCDREVIDPRLVKLEEFFKKD